MSDFPEIPHDDIGVRFANEPFAYGELRCAFKGRAGNFFPFKRGDKLVVKTWIKGHAMDLGEWDEHLACERKLSEFIEEWNALKISSFKYDAVKSAPGTVSKAAESRCVLDEWVLNEPYLEGEWIKWNSNTGGVDPNRFGSCVQAFCHWTWHHSKGEYLYCDAQGVQDDEARTITLTDPCIVSKEQDKFGITDGGELMQMRWFADHRCNSFCGKWGKPSREDRRSAKELMPTATMHSTYVATWQKKLLGAEDKVDKSLLTAKVAKLWNELKSRVRKNKN
jgi:hypothetical protein